MMKLRFFLALWAAKISIVVLEITRHNGTQLPGRIAFKICPYFLKYVEKPDTILAITGTNGKTTVSNMIIDILEKKGKRILNNRAGSNIKDGIATAFIRKSNLMGHIHKCDIAVLEVDERSSTRIYPFIEPNYIVITNLFRDSIMRNAHPEYIANILTKSIPPKSKLILNADDLISCEVAPSNNRVYFGLELGDNSNQPTANPIKCENLLNDVRICPRCNGKLNYTYRLYHHIGRATCENCGFSSPKPKYLASDIDIKNKTMIISEQNKNPVSCSLIADSYFNIYNILTTIATLRELNLTYEEIIPEVEQLSIVSSRLSREQIGEIGIVMQMSKDKNALACSRNFDYIRSSPGKKELLLMMNCLDVAKNWSENPCWMYDSDFEFLNNDDISHLVCAGARAKDYKLRLLLAGIPEEKISVEEDEYKSINLLHLTPGEDVYFLYGVDGMPLAFSVKEKLRKILLEREGTKHDS